MRLVIDSNRLMACLLKDSASRRIIFDERLRFCSPDYLITEIEKYMGYLSRKTRQTEGQVEVILYSLLERVDLIPYEEFKDEMAAALEIFRDVDAKDAPFLAVGMALEADGIWSEDRHFRKQKMLRVYTTKDLLEMMAGTR